MARYSHLNVIGEAYQIRLKKYSREKNNDQDVKEKKKIFSSFRDPSGFLFFSEGTLYRQINPIYKDDYELLMNSGLYKSLVVDGLLIPHKEEKDNKLQSAKAHKIIKPEKIKFISYPYEWSFGQLKAASLATLAIQKKALEFNMSLKDASAYNIQFKDNKPIFIDTLSFERYVKNKPWIAYKQFCQHFLGPLALASCRDIRLSQLLRIYLDGVPLDLVSSLLPFSTQIKPSLLIHIHLHARSQKHFSRRGLHLAKGKMSLFSLRGLIDSLEAAIKKMKCKTSKTQWSEYYEDKSYSLEAFDDKIFIVSDFLDKIKPKSVWDFGANTGEFSRIAASKGFFTVSFDSDPSVVEKNYLTAVEKNEKNILPLLCDLTNPSPAIGWANKERLSYLQRTLPEAVLVLALVHHLTIGYNLPFARLAEFFAKISKFLIIEFIPKNDPQVKKMLSSRDDIFSTYSKDFFEQEFTNFFKIHSSLALKDSARFLYLMERIESPRVH